MIVVRCVVAVVCFVLLGDVRVLCFVVCRNVLSVVCCLLFFVVVFGSLLSLCDVVARCPLWFSDFA